MKCCMKSLRKIPMALVGAVDLGVSGMVWAVNQLSKRGEKVVDKLEKNCCSNECSCKNECCAEPDEPITSSP